MLAVRRRSSMKGWGNNGILYWILVVLRSPFSVLGSQFWTENGERRTQNVEPKTLFFQLDDRDAASALLWRRRGNPRHERMLLQESGQRAFQLARAVPVDQPHHAL